MGCDPPLPKGAHNFTSANISCPYIIENPTMMYASSKQTTEAKPTPSPVPADSQGIIPYGKREPMALVTAPPVLFLAFHAL